MKKRPTPQAPTTGTGSVSAHEVLTLREFGRRLGMGSRAFCDAQNAGLKTALHGRTKYVVGKHVLEYFERLADEQAQESQG